MSCILVLAWNVARARKCAVCACALLLTVFGACVARRFAHDNNAAVSNGSARAPGESPWPLERWQQVTIVKVVAADTFVVSRAQEPRSQTLSLFGLRGSPSLDPRVSRQGVLSRLMPGNMVEVDVMARSDGGRLLGRLHDTRGDVGIWLAERGVVVPFLVCRGVDQCSPQLLDSARVYELAKACSKAPGNVVPGQVDATRDFIERENIRWVGDIRDHTFVSPWRRYEVPLCYRIYFAGRKTEPDAQLGAAIEQLGFRPRGGHDDASVNAEDTSDDGHEKTR